MYAIIADGGRQYKVEEGLVLELDYRDVPAGESVKFDHVLAVSGTSGLLLGSPHVEGASVVGEVLGPALGPKLTVQKLRRRKNSRRRTGHRQMYTRVRIDQIFPDAAAAAAAPPKQDPAPAADPAPEASSDSPTDDAGSATSEE